jgi:hypothetical protein
MSNGGRSSTAKKSRNEDELESNDIVEESYLGMMSGSKGYSDKKKDTASVIDE